MMYNENQAIEFPTQAELQSLGFKALREWAGRSFKGVERYQAKRRGAEAEVIELPNRGGVLLVEPVPLDPDVPAPVGTQHAVSEEQLGTMHRAPTLAHYLADREIAVMTVELLAATEHMPVEEIEDLLAQIVGEIKLHRGRTNGLKLE